MHLAKTYTLDNAQKSKCKPKKIYKYHKCIEQKLAQLPNASKKQESKTTYIEFL